MIHLKTYLRYLLKNKLYTSVTILGFAISVTFILLLSVYIQNELKVDDFHVNKDHIYRIEHEETHFSGPIAEYLKNSIPDIDDYTRIYSQNGMVTTNSDQKLRLDYLAVDNSFFNMFLFPLIRGVATEVLSVKNSIVLSKSFSHKLFGEIKPLGKKVAININTEFIVTGIMENFPENTHFKNQDALINMKAMAGITTLSITLLTVSLQSFRAATNNPIDALREE